MHNNLACLIILWIFSPHLLRNFYVDIFFLVSIFNSYYLQIVKIRTRHVRLHKNPSNNSGHSTIRAIQVVRIAVRLARVLICILDKIYSIY